MAHNGSPSVRNGCATTMFKKKPQVNSSSNIKSSERRGLLAEICKQFNVSKEHLSKEQELDLVPSTVKQATYHSIQNHKGTIYYNTDEQPLWYRVRGSELYPTVFTLWRAGYLLPVVLTNGHVIERIVGNANLMLPGCIPPIDPRAKRGALVGVACYKNPTVILATGICEFNLAQFDDAEQRQGVAVTIHHRIEDELFNLYDHEVKIPQEVDDTFPGPEEPEAAQEVKAEKEKAEEEKAEEEKTEASEPEPVESSEVGQEQDPADGLAEVVDKLAVEDIDNFFLRSFLQSVKTRKLELPLTSSKFMSDYVLKNLPRMDAKFANIKKTSWKKSAKFLKALEKMKYVSLKGKGDDVSIVAISVPQDIIDNFVTHRTIEPKSGGATEKKDAHKMTVLNLYKPTNKTKEVLDKLELPNPRIYQASQLKEILNDYIKKFELADKKNPKMVKIDGVLASAISSKDTQMGRDKIFTPFVKNFSPHYTLLAPGATYDSSSVVKKGEPRKIKVLTQTVLGRKTTTNVSDFEHFNIKPQTFAEELKNLCSASTSIGTCKNNPAITEVMVQGPHGPAIINYLKDKGVPVAFIDFEDKSKSRKKRS